MAIDKRKVWAAALGALAWAAAALAASPARAEPPVLGPPLDCRPGIDCWAVRYVDHAPGPENRDFHCGWATSKGHKGTDFAIAHRQAMREGVDVLAVADGEVVGVRDGMADRLVEGGDDPRVAGRECGNGVRLDHGNGWSTQYCHLRKGSVRVKRGARVAKGDPLGLVGLSGETSFPHVHLTVDKDGTLIDPFTGGERTAECGQPVFPLWEGAVLDAFPYQATVLANAGFASTRPRKDTARDGGYAAESLSRRAPVLVLWLDAYWLRTGDRMRFSITGPDGQPVLDYAKTIEQDAEHPFFYAGAKRETLFWPQGSYRGEVRVSRDSSPAGPKTFSLTRTVTVR